MKNIWYFEEVDLNEILCPHKFKDHCDMHPMDCYNKMDFLFSPGDHAKEIYLIAEGKVKIGYYDDAGNEFVRAILGKGELLGVSAFLGEKKRKNFAEIIEDNTYICKLDVDKAKELTRDYRGFEFEIHKRIGQRIQKLERRIEILLFKDARIRLIEFIKDLAEEKGKPSEKGIEIQHDLTQGEIAKLIGTSRKTASLLLNELEDEGLISQSRGMMTIPALNALL